MTKRIAIIGAGLSGLIAAQVLKDKAHVCLFDKSRGVGGRMSTRYAGQYEFDHGAQYFTARDVRFQKVVLGAIEQGAVAPWRARALYKKDGKMLPDTGGDRFVSIPRMNSWTKDLAKGLDVTLGTRVSGLAREQNKWTLNFEDGTSQGHFDYVVSAVPSIQAQALLPAEFGGMAALESTQMDACFALMVGFEKQYNFGWDSLRVNDEINTWLAVNSSKYGRNNNFTTLMVHAAPDWSNTHAEADRAWVQAQMEASASGLCGVDINKAPHRVLHRWLYASVSRSPEQGALHDPALGLVACGDWCLGGRVEGAYLSGLAAADNLLNNL